MTDFDRDPDITKAYDNLEKVEPPAELDHAVAVMLEQELGLEEGVKEVGEPPQQEETRQPKKNGVTHIWRWYFPATLAATVMVAVSVALIGVLQAPQPFAPDRSLSDAEVPLSTRTQTVEEAADAEQASVPEKKEASSLQRVAPKPEFSPSPKTRQRAMSPPAPPMEALQSQAADEAGVGMASDRLQVQPLSEPQPQAKSKRAPAAVPPLPPGEEADAHADEVVSALQRIRVLREAGKIEAAREALETFVSLYPDYPIGDLQELLDSGDKRSD